MHSVRPFQEQSDHMCNRDADLAAAAPLTLLLRPFSFDAAAAAETPEIVRVSLAARPSVQRGRARPNSPSVILKVAELQSSPKSWQCYSPPAFIHVVFSRGIGTALHWCRIFWYAMFCALCFEIGTPSLFSPLPSGVKIPKQNMHSTFQNVLHRCTHNE